ncbi:MAG: hypothetical protein ACUVT3_02960 [Ignavibacterium sp.]
MTVSGLTIEKNNSIIATNVRTIDFRGGVIAEAGTNNDVNLFITLSGFEDSVFIPSGVYNVNLTDQINGSTSTFTINDTIIPTSLQVFVNGLQQSPSGVTTNSFSLDFTPQSGDILYINYDKLVGIPAAVSLSHSSLSNLDNDDHPQYLNYSRAINYFYTEAEVDNLIAPLVSFSGLLPTEVGDLIVGNSTGTFSKLGAVSSGGLVLVTDPSSTYGIGWASPSSLSTRRLHQQIVFTIVGNNLDIAEIKPIRIYVQELGENAQIDEILAYVNTPAQINNLRLGVLRNGTNIFSTYLEIPVGQNQKLMNTGFNDTIMHNDYFQLAIYQGDNFAADLTLHIRFSSEV